LTSNIPSAHKLTEMFLNEQRSETKTKNKHVVYSKKSFKINPLKEINTQGLGIDQNIEDLSVSPGIYKKMSRLPTPKIHEFKMKEKDRYGDSNESLFKQLSPVVKGKKVS